MPPVRPLRTQPEPEFVPLSPTATAQEMEAAVSAALSKARDLIPDAACRVARLNTMARTLAGAKRHDLEARVSKASLTLSEFAHALDGATREP
jgi:hypothetical protein